MDATLGAILGAAIGAVSGLSGGMLTSWRQARLEHEKWLRGREDLLANELRIALQQLTVKLASAAHSMCWLTWLAKEGPARITQERIDGYDDEMHALLPEITGQQAMVAALDRRAFDQLSELVARVFAADAQIGTAGLQFEPGDPESAQALGDLYDDTWALAETIPHEVAQILRRADRSG